MSVAALQALAQGLPSHAQARGREQVLGHVRASLALASVPFLALGGVMLVLVQAHGPALPLLQHACRAQWVRVPKQAQELAREQAHAGAWGRVHGAVTGHAWQLLQHQRSPCWVQGRVRGLACRWTQGSEQIQ